jgi:hypothetical protein
MSTKEIVKKDSYSYEGIANQNALNKVRQAIYIYEGEKIKVHIEVVKK